MNKLLVSDIINLKDGIYNLCSKDGNLEIIIKGNVTIYLYDEEINNISLKLEEESNLFVYDYRCNCHDCHVTIEQSHNSKVHYNCSLQNYGNSNYRIYNNITGDNNESYLSIRNISHKDSSKITINVKIDEKTKNNIALEDLKGIFDGGSVMIEPNIIALSNEVVANHLTTIGGVDKTNLYYLMSKGIKEIEAKKILLKGFIYSNMDELIKNMGGDKNA